MSTLTLESIKKLNLKSFDPYSAKTLLRGVCVSFPSYKDYLIRALSFAKMIMVEFENGNEIKDDGTKINLVVRLRAFDIDTQHHDIVMENMDLLNVMSVFAAFMFCTTSELEENLENYIIRLTQSIANWSE